MMYPFETDETRMVEQCIKSINGLKPKLSADLQREFDFVQNELKYRLPRKTVEEGTERWCPTCGAELHWTPPFAMYCHHCGQFVICLDEESF